MGLRSNIMVQDLDIYCSRGYCSSNNTTAKIQTQKTTIKNPRPKEAKAKDPKPILFYNNMVEPLEQEKKDQKDKKKKFQ